METYADIVKRSFKNKKSNLLYNCSKKHAKFLLIELFNEAKNEINCYTSGTDINFYDNREIQTIIKNKEKVAIKIILDDKKKIREFKNLFPFAKFYAIKPNKKIAGIKTPPSIKDKEFDKIKHFITIDKQAFRVETPHDNTPENVTAIACANDTIVSEQLNGIFKTLQEEFSEVIKEH